MGCVKAVLAIRIVEDCVDVRWREDDEIAPRFLELPCDAISELFGFVFLRTRHRKIDE